FLDDDSSHEAYVLPTGSTIAAGGYFVIDQLSATAPGFDFGLGGADTVRVYDPAGDLVLRYAWTAHAAVTYGRCPDGTGALMDTTASTKGAANDCSSPVRINEVESDGGTPGDWVELTNTGTTTVDLGGYVFSDSDDAHVYAIPSGTTVAPGGFTVLDEQDFGFGLGKADSARLLDPRGDPRRLVLVDGARRDDVRPEPRRHRGVRRDGRTDQGCRQPVRRRGHRRGVARRSGRAGARRRGHLHR
ncbi:lamin tail domain-containing protein, partial [Curtobacterium sp. B18]|uniref:lamin tail domain-containing protein n=1 Tax=Curtobacterium sp. B18 TaxID=95614 RepID=UPI001C9E0AEB